MTLIVQVVGTLKLELL